MADIPWGQLVGVGAQLLATQQGNQAAGKLSEEEKKILLESLAEYNGITAPNLPAEQLGTSAYEGIQTDPALQAAQMEALSQLSNVYKNGGMNLSDQAALADIQQRSAMAEQSSRNGIREGMAQRGVSGGGAELAMQMAAQQGAANRSASGGLEVAANAQKRALDAMMARGRMAGDIRGQDYSEKARAAQAADEIARYNANSRTTAPQQAFQNRMTVANGRANARKPVSGWYGDEAQGKRMEYGGYGSAAAGAGRAVDSARSSQSTDYDSSERARRGKAAEDAWN